MEFVTRMAGDVLVVGVAEPMTLEASNAAKFRDALADLLEGATTVVIDMQEINLLDSSGLAVFVAIWRGISSRGGEIRLSGMDPLMRRVFEVTRVSELFEMFETVEEALTGPKDNPKAQETGNVRERSSSEVAARPSLSYQ